MLTLGRGPAAARDPRARLALFAVASIAAIGVVVLMAAQMVVFLTLPPPGFTPTPDNTRAWFALFEASPVVALVNLDVPMLVDFVLVLVVFVALWAALRRRCPTLALLGVVFAVVSAAVYLASNPAFTMMALAEGFRAAPAGEQALYIAAGQAILATYHGTPFDVGYVLSAIAGLLMTFAMLRSDVFGRATAYIGLVVFSMNLVPPTAGTVGMVLSLGSLPPLVVWLILVARRFWTLDRDPPDDTRVLLDAAARTTLCP